MARLFAEVGLVITIIALRDRDLLKSLQGVIRWFFPFEAEHYAKIADDEYRYIVSLAQDAMNEAVFARRLVSDMHDSIRQVLRSDDILVQSNVYLRAARPIDVPQESVGWHRESFYGCPPKALNFWMPVMNVTPSNSIRYIPGSERIPDSQLVTKQDEDPNTPKGSAGHKIGLLYAPKRIVSGVDFTQARSMDVGESEAVLFPGSLIHGAAVNRTADIRFSIDFRLIAKENLVRTDQRSDFFIPLEAA